MLRTMPMSQRRDMGHPDLYQRRDTVVSLSESGYVRIPIRVEICAPVSVEIRAYSRQSLDR